jgi:hypothetical protein
MSESFERQTGDQLKEIVGLLKILNENIVALIRLFEKYDSELFENDEELREIELKQSGLNRGKNIRGSAGR